MDGGGADARGAGSPLGLRRDYSMPAVLQAEANSPVQTSAAV
jgi:hypothetical protein